MQPMTPPTDHAYALNLLFTQLGHLAETLGLPADCLGDGLEPIIGAVERLKKDLANETARANECAISGIAAGRDAQKARVALRDIIGAAQTALED